MTALVGNSLDTDRPLRVMGGGDQHEFAASPAPAAQLFVEKIIEHGQGLGLDERGEAVRARLRALNVEQDRPGQVELDDDALCIEREIGNGGEVVDVGVFAVQRIGLVIGQAQGLVAHLELDPVHLEFVHQPCLLPCGVRVCLRVCVQCRARCCDPVGLFLLQPFFGALAQGGRIGPRAVAGNDHLREVEQALVLCADDAVALAHAGFEAGAVRDRDLPAAVLDEPGGLQLARRLGDRLAAHAEHVGDQLLGHVQLIVGQLVEAQQQPAAQLLIHRVMAVAHHALGHLRHQRLRVGQRQAQQVAVLVEFPGHHFGAQSPRRACALDHRLVRGGPATEHERNADQAVLAGHGQFGGGAVLGGEHQGHDAGGGEVNEAEHVSRLVEHMTERQCDEFEIVDQSGTLVDRKGGEDAVLAGARCQWIAHPGFLDCYALRARCCVLGGGALANRFVQPEMQY